jgi:hypothetical protein
MTTTHSAADEMRPCDSGEPNYYHETKGERDELESSTG